MPDPSPNEVSFELPLRGPSRIGRYDLAFQLATGGMATVYLAAARGPGGFDKVVALKRIHPHLANDAEYVDMFLEEARLAARLSHPNICSVFDFGEGEGGYFIAMEYLIGEPLSLVLPRLQRSKLRFGDRHHVVISKILADTCEGLHAAHELADAQGNLLGVVHRDVTPSNVFVAYDGGTRVVDFGIAVARDRHFETQSGRIKGKFAYLAPEQVKSLPVDRRTDVFALGIVLWEALTLKRLFRRPTESETIYAVLESEIPAPSSVRPGVPAALDAIAMKALARDPADRYQTARALGRDLVRHARSSSDTIDLPEVAEFMRELFPSGEAHKRELIEATRAAKGKGVVPLPASSRDSLDMDSLAGTPAPARPRARWLLLAVAIGLVVAVGLAGVAVGLVVKGAPLAELKGEPPKVSMPAPAEPLAAPEPEPPDPVVPEVEAVAMVARPIMRRAGDRSRMETGAMTVTIGTDFDL